VASFLEYEDLTEDQLFDQIGRYFLGEGLGMGPSNRRRFIAMGRDWFEEKIDQIKNIVCTEDSRTKFNNNAEWVSIVGPIIGAKLHVEAAIYLPVCAIVVRSGIDKFCSTSFFEG
jgi:hypothetical protein